MGKVKIWTLTGAVAASCLFGDCVVRAQTIPPPRVWIAPAPASPTGTDAKVRRVQSAQPIVRDDSNDTMKTPASPPTLLDPNTRPIDLNTALRLAGVQNPQLMIARQRVLEAAALRQLAAAQFLPSLNLGTNYDTHTGNLQQSNGNILGVNRSAVYVGAGASAVGSGTVNIPGVVLQGNVAAVVYGYLASRQVVAQREFATLAIRNQTFLQTTLAYSELLRAEGRRAVNLQVRDEAKRVADLTAAYANAGQGRQADAHRAQTELESRESDVQAAEGEVLVSSARLCYVLNLDPSIRLHPTDAFIVPHPIVPDPAPVSELIALGLLQRPELGERRAAIVEALLYLQGAKVLPFSPTILIGYSSGGFGGGSNLVRPVFGGFGGRSDFDAMAYWTLQNLGVGNLSMINLARARLGVTRYQEIAVLDQVRAEVAEAYAKTHARYARIETTERAVRSATKGFREDLIRIENTVAPAIETTDSLRLLARARSAYLDAIVDYDRAQFELFVALGQPPADALARPVPTEGVTPPGEPLIDLPENRPGPGGPG
jgi:outer membrane protein TolC